MPDWTIFLDMDGVCVDFTTSALKVHNRLDLAPNPGWLPKSLGITEDEFWAPINALGADFWHHAEPYPWFDALHGGLRELAPVVFLTTPSPSPSSAQGKMQWLQDRFGAGFRDYVFTPHQRYCSWWPHAILIDDKESNLAEWTGHSIRFPQPWNDAKHRPDPTTVVADILAAVNVLRAA